MLDSIRKRQNNIIFSGMILLIVAVMALYGVGQMGKHQEVGDGVAAWVNGELISRRDFQQELERRIYQYQALFGGQMDDKFLDQLQLPQKTMEDLIEYKLLAQTAKKMDIIISDAELADHIRSLPYFQKDGKFSAELYSKLPNRGLEEKFRRERLQISRLQSYLSDRVRLTPTALKTAVELANTRINLEYAKLDLKTVGGERKPSAQELQNFMKSTSESELQAFYESNKKDYTHPAAAKLRQIRIGLPFDARGEKREEARKKIEDIAKEVNETNFAAVAKAKSDDEYAKKGGEVGWVDQDKLEKALTAAVKSLEVNRISPPVETPLGFYILQVQEKKEETVDPLPKVRQTVAERLLTQRIAKETFEKKRVAWEKMLAEGKSIEPELKTARIEVKKSGVFSLGQGYIPGIGQADTILDGVFELSTKSPIGKKLYSHHDNFYYVKLVSVEHPKPTDFNKSRLVTDRTASSALQSALLTQWLAAIQKTSNVKTEMRLQTKTAGLGFLH